jgi:hypothetical protein
MRKSLSKCLKVREEGGKKREATIKKWNPLKAVAGN